MALCPFQEVISIHNRLYFIEYQVPSAEGHLWVVYSGRNVFPLNLLSEVVCGRCRIHWCPQVKESWNDMFHDVKLVIPIGSVCLLWDCCLQTRPEIFLQSYNLLVGELQNLDFCSLLKFKATFDILWPISSKPWSWWVYLSLNLIWN